MKAKPKILIVDDNPEDLRVISSALKEDLQIITASSLDEAKNSLFSFPDIVLLDIRLDNSNVSNKEGIELLKFIKSEFPELPVIMITAYGDIDIAVEAMKLGAADFIQKGKMNLGEVRKRILNLLEKSKLQKKVLELEEVLNRLEPWEIIGDDPKITEIKKMIDLVAKDGEITVLIRGETGTGKELVARNIHKKGVRRDNPFVPVSIGALSKSVIESELFGHEKGAFTGADHRKIGYIERANGGILFLDEIGELEPEIQVKLLRFLDSKSFTRVGGSNEIKVDLQVIAATNKDLEREIEEGRFRKDFYFRLKTFQIFIPPLSERRNDIPKLANYFLNYFRSQGRTHINRIDPEAINRLKEYDWVGNVRELKSCIEQAIIYAHRNGHDRLQLEDLPLDIHQRRKNINGLIRLNGTINIEEEKARLELKYIEEALRISKGKKTEAWKILGYNDRFALRRRILSIAENFNDVLDEFPYIKSRYLNSDLEMKKDSRDNLKKEYCQKLIK